MTCKELILLWSVVLNCDAKRRIIESPPGRHRSRFPWEPEYVGGGERAAWRIPVGQPLNPPEGWSLVWTQYSVVGNITLSGHKMAEFECRHCDF
jgi:hypothetical protein